MTNKTSVIVITLNRCNRLKRCLKSLENQTRKPLELIVVDNGSTDETKKVTETFKKKGKIKYIFVERQGYARARNAGLKYAKGEIIAFTDDDCIVTRDWIEKIEESFQNINADAIGGRVDNNIDTPLTWANHILQYSKWISKKSKFVTDIPTANIAYLKKSIRGMHFPQNTNKYGYEDTIFNSQMIKKGMKIFYNSDIVVYHDNKILTKADFVESQRKWVRSFFYNGFIVHGILGKIVKYFPWIFMLRSMSIFRRCIFSKKYHKIYFDNFGKIMYGDLIRTRELSKLGRKV